MTSQLQVKSLQTRCNIPVRSSLWATIKRRPLLTFAHSDRASYSVFEEAFTLGPRAA